MNKDMLESKPELSAAFAETYKNSLFLFLDALKAENTKGAQVFLHDFLESSQLSPVLNMIDYKNALKMVNSFCQLTFLSTNIHPSHIIRLYSSLEERIDLCEHKESLFSLANDICHKYTLLLTNFAFPEYSKTVRSVINYINLHLNEDLTLAFLAKHFQKNATSLSSAFSKEVGINVTNYIHQTRINEAIRYFNTTKMSISEVALAVGFQDFAYFSRLFHKQIGCSPREYCRGINR